MSNYIWMICSYQITLHGSVVRVKLCMGDTCMSNDIARMCHACVKLCMDDTCISNDIAWMCRAC